MRQEISVPISASTLPLSGLIEILPNKFEDSRGYFAETWRRDHFAAIGVDSDWVQDNQSCSVEVGTLRGLHYQEPPFAQNKLVRVLRGSILDVAVDIRQGSPSFGAWAAVELSAARMNQFFVPAGFAHGFVTLVPDTEVFYKVSAPYSAKYDRAIRWNDPAIGIDWRLGTRLPVLSEKDRAAPLLVEVESPFRYAEGSGRR